MQKPRNSIEWSYGTLLNGGFDAATGHEALANGATDAIAYGVPFIANPDLPTRFRTGANLNAPNRDAFYTPGSRGYTDYRAFLWPSSD